MEKAKLSKTKSLSETGLAQPLEACLTHDEEIKMPIQIRITLRKSPCIKTVNTTINNLNLIQITPPITSTQFPKDCGEGITLTVLNAQSLSNKAAIFTDFICQHQPDLLAVTETWFSDKESAPKTQCTPTGYRFFDHARSGRQGGGTGLLFKRNLKVTKVTGGERQSFEYS